MVIILSCIFLVWKIKFNTLTKGVGPSTTLAWPGWKQPELEFFKSLWGLGIEEE
jgi:hypothetical protein